MVCARTVFDSIRPAPTEGARVVVYAKPDFNATRGSFALTALEIRAVGIGELLARLERLRKELAAEGLFSAERKRALPFLPGVIGLICGRESAAERDVVQNAQRRWPAVRFRIEQSAVQGPYAAGEVIEALRDAPPLGDDRLEAIRVFTLRVLDTAGDVGDDALAAFLASGYTRQQALEVVLGIGTYTMSTLANRLTDAPLDDQLTAFAWHSVTA